MKNRWLNVIALLFILLICLQAYSQKRKKTNWIQDKNAHETRWRIGSGIHIGEPTGIHLQFYRLCRICTQSIAIRKKISIDASLSKEGYIIPTLIENNNNSWQRGGTRIGLYFKYYLPFSLNPYLGIGIESGSRNINSSSGFYSDLVGRIGVEQKLFGTRLSSKSLIHSGFFIEGKYNKCLTNNFTYLTPTIGLRFHFL
jgi:hypothetical protein